MFVFVHLSGLNQTNEHEQEYKTSLVFVLFVYNTKEVNLSKKVELNAKDKTVKSILEQILANTGISFYEEGNNIVLTKNSSKKKISVKGKIIDFNGEPIIGATVKEQGTTNGTITDFDGNFKITVKEGSSLFVSYVGYQNKSVKAVTCNIDGRY